MLDKMIVELLNQQINREFQSTYFYLEISNYYYSSGLSGFGTWFNIQSQRELEHAKIFMTYLLNHKEKILLNDVRPHPVRYRGFLEPLSFSLSNEQENSKRINEIYDDARLRKDQETVLFLTNFIGKQFLEERNIRELLEEFEQTGLSDNELYLMDFKAGKRKESLHQ